MAVSTSPSEAAAAGTPPHNDEAETSVLGAILLSAPAFDAVQVEVALQPEDFWRERHGWIYSAMVSLRTKPDPEPIDPTTICEQLTQDGKLDQAGGRDYVHSLPSLVAAVGNARHYAKIVKDNALLRRLLEKTRVIQDDVLSRRGEARELIDEAESSLFKLRDDELRGELRKIEQVLDDELVKLERVSKEGIQVSGTPSGFRDLDKLTGGFQPGNLIVVAARPSMGKSALVCNIAENAAVGYDKHVAFFSLEMSETELAQRFIATQASLNGDDLRKGQISANKWPKINKATAKLAAADLLIDDSSDLGILDLRAKARRLHGRKKLDLVMVDYLQLMRPENTRDSRVEQISQISRGLKILARELEIPVIAVSQLSRAVEQRPDKRPMLSDLRESGQIEQDADLVVFIYRDEYYRRDDEEEAPVEDDNSAELLISKHRNGPVGTVRLAFIKRHPRFTDIAYEPSSEAPPAAAPAESAA